WPSRRFWPETVDHVLAATIARGSRAPEHGDRCGDDLLVEFVESRSGVQYEARDEALTEFVAEPAQVLGILARRRRRRRLDLDSDQALSCKLHDQVDLVASLLRPQVVQPWPRRRDRE